MSKPLPSPNADTRRFWDGAAAGELRFQYCVACERAQFPPRRVCIQCHGSGLEWRIATGIGVIHSYTVVHRAPTPAFKGDVPYVIALVDLLEGFRMMLNVRGCDPGKVRIGMKVKVTFELQDGAVALPQCEPT